jgi:DNA-directed RNA polymerase subunit RPC12/RpoP
VKPTNLTRYTFDLGGETHNYSALRHYVCSECGGGVAHSFVGGDHVACGRCGGEDIISERKYLQQVSDGLDWMYAMRNLRPDLIRKDGSMPLNDRENRRLSRLGFIRLGYRAFKCKQCGTHVKWDGHERQRCTQCDTQRTNLVQDGRPASWLFPKQSSCFLLHDAPDIQEYYAKQGIHEVQELDIMLPFRELERNYDANYEVWAGRILCCQGDGTYVKYATPYKLADVRGETRVRTAPGDTLVSRGVAEIPFDWGGEHFDPGDHVPCPGAKQGLYPHCFACKISGILKVMMWDPGLFRFGYYQINTGSGNNHDVIMGTLETMNLNDYRGFPFTLSLIEGETTYLDDQKVRRRTKKWFLNLEPRKEETRELYSGTVARSLGAPELPASVDPEWDDTIDMDPDPVPPPYAAARAEEEEGIVEPEPPVKVDPIPVPNGLSHKTIVELAVKHLGYAHEGAVKGAMYAIIRDTKWYESTEWSPKDVWFQLQDHAASE